MTARWEMKSSGLADMVSASESHPGWGAHQTEHPGWGGDEQQARRPLGGPIDAYSSALWLRPVEGEVAASGSVQPRYSLATAGERAAQVTQQACGGHEE